MAAIQENGERSKKRVDVVDVAKETSLETGYVVAWDGTEMYPDRLTVMDPNDPTTILLDEEVDHMKDGIILARDGHMLGTYKRTIISQPIESSYVDGEPTRWHQEIIFYPINSGRFLRSFLQATGVVDVESFLNSVTNSPDTLE